MRFALCLGIVVLFAGFVYAGEKETPKKEETKVIKFYYFDKEGNKKPAKTQRPIKDGEDFGEWSTGKKNGEIVSKSNNIIKIQEKSCSDDKCKIQKVKKNIKVTVNYSNCNSRGCGSSDTTLTHISKQNFSTW